MRALSPIPLPASPGSVFSGVIARLSRGLQRSVPRQALNVAGVVPSWGGRLPRGNETSVSHHGVSSCNETRRSLDSLHD
jgi:hypothetical protein